MYFVTRLGFLYPMVAQFVDTFAPSFWIHFRRWPLLDVANKVSVGLLVFSDFAFFGCESVERSHNLITFDIGHKKVKRPQNKRKEEGENRNLFEWIYHFVNLDS